MRLILARGQQECTNLAIIPTGLRGLHKWPLKNEGYPSECAGDSEMGPVKGIKGRMRERKTGHSEDIWKTSFESDRDLPQKNTKTDQFCVALKTLKPLSLITSNTALL